MEEKDKKDKEDHENQQRAISGLEEEKSKNDANHTRDLLQRLALDWPSPQLQATWHYAHLTTHHADADYVASAAAAVVIAATRTGHGATKMRLEHHGGLLEALESLAEQRIRLLQLALAPQ